MRTAQPGSDIGQETGSYVQLLIYRVPKKNQEAFARVESALAGTFNKHGILRSEFYALGPAKISRTSRASR